MRRLFATGALLALALTGCSSADTGNGVASANGAAAGSAPPSASASLTNEERGRKFAQCMRDHGVDMPDPDPNGGLGGQGFDRNNPNLQKALDACKEFLPNGGDLSKTDPKMVDQLRVFTQCLRDNGLDVPDPDPNSPMLGMGQMATIDQNSPAFKKAMEACKDKVPNRGGK